MAQDYPRPLPAPSPLSSPYWAGLSEGRVRLQQCGACGECIFYPRPHCPACLSQSLDWVTATGRGKVYSFTIVRRAMNPAFSPDVPYVYAIVELEEGPRLITNVVGCPVDDVRVDMPVKAVYDKVTPEHTLLKFAPVEAERR
jgi:uncharacterized OB-fold protein